MGGCLGISLAGLGWWRLPGSGPTPCPCRAGTVRGAPGISGAPSSTSSALPSFEGPSFAARAGAFLPFHLCCLSQRKPISLFFNRLKVFFGGFSGYFEAHFSQMCFFFLLLFFLFSSSVTFLLRLKVSGHVTFSLHPRGSEKPQEAET